MSKPTKRWLSFRLVGFFVAVAIQSMATAQLSAFWTGVALGALCVGVMSFIEANTQ